MALINADGIVFQNGTSLTSKYGIIPQDTVQVFYQASAPTGWTQVTHHDPPLNLESINNKALRVVSGLTGGSFAGTNNFTTTFPSTSVPISATVILDGTVEDTTLTLNQIPSHAHGAGSADNTFTASAATSPFRTEVRTPVSYAFRSAYRQIVNFRTLVNFQQPTTVRQPVTYRQPVANRQPQNIQQPVVNRRPYAFRFRYDRRQPITVFQPRSFRQPGSFRAPGNVRQPLRRRVEVFNPVRYPFSFGGRRSPARGRRRRYQNPISTSRRRPGNRPRRTFGNRQRPVFRQAPFNRQTPFNFTATLSYRVSYRFRQPRNNQQPIVNRRPYSSRVIVNSRVLANQRVIVNQRNPASYRQPNSYRQEVRYPVINNVRYSSRVLTPGGAIRGTDANGPATSSVGGGGAHNHTFTGTISPISGSIDISVQYIDVIICKFD